MDDKEKFSVVVIEGKDKGNVENPKEFEVTTYVFHEIGLAEETAQELIDDGIFSEVRIRIYYPAEKDEGFVLVGSHE